MILTRNFYFANISVDNTLRIMPKSLKFETPKLTVDIIIFTVENGQFKTLLIKRKSPPFKGKWALPGGFLKKEEPIYSAVLRELKEETGVEGVYLEQLYTFGEPKRDPRGRVITVAYYALAPRELMKIKAADDAKNAKLFSMTELPKLAFDHKKILNYALFRIRNKIQYTNVIWSLLPRNFTLTEIQKVYELIWNKHLDKRNFRKKLLSLGLLKSKRQMHQGGRQRPAKLYSFKSIKYVELKRFF